MEARCCFFPPQLQLPWLEGFPLKGSFEEEGVRLIIACLLAVDEVGGLVLAGLGLAFGVMPKHDLSPGPGGCRLLHVVRHRAQGPCCVLADPDLIPDRLGPGAWTSTVCVREALVKVATAPGEIHR